ncbi:hypothetical protein [Streptomyces goshikiensis]|uniref:hypothetical protein n=1 Tax=Streptomyces goshikiensis TaxID=1942 RepID=UPI00371502C9
MSPLMFAVVYLPEHIQDPVTGEITFSEAHIEWAELAKTWTRTTDRKPAGNRHAFIAPRNLGKSTWWYLIFPMWWAAYGYSEFTAAFANSDTQAQTHLKSFRKELDDNERLREDFPDLCKRKNKPRGVPEGDAAGMRVCGNGFVFVAKGIDSQSLGLKIGSKRPDTLLLDDIEPDEGNYSPYMKDQRLTTLIDAVLPLSRMANVVLAGTVTMYGSIVHDLVKHAQGNTVDWVNEEKFKVHHHLPFIQSEDPTTPERSIWPGNPIFDLEAMEEIRHTRQFRKNFENDPAAVDSEYWSSADFTYGTFDTPHTYLSIDGAVTTGRKSDYTGIAVVGCGDKPRRCLVKFATQVRKQGAELRTYVLGMLEAFPEIDRILIETNQGGDMWLEVLHDMPVKIVTVHNTVRKETRAARLLNLYQAKPARVMHTEPFPALETQMCQFPAAPNDDILDAVGNAVHRWILPDRKPKAVIRQRFPV